MIGSVADIQLNLNRIESQHVAGEESRPDIAGFSQGNQLEIFVEGKFWAGLTDAQPVEYLNRLTEGGGRALVFIVPEARLDSILDELGGRIRSSGNVTSVTWGSVSRARVTHINKKTSVIVASWSAVLEVIKTACIYASDRSSEADIDQLRELVILTEGEGFRPIAKSSLSNLEVPLTLMNLVDVCFKAVKSADSQNIVKIGKLKYGCSDHWIGRYAAFPTAGAWIGLNFKAWRTYQASPLWVWFQPGKWGRGEKISEAFASWKTTIPRKLFCNTDGDAYIPIIVPSKEEDVVITAIVQQLREIGDHLEKAKLPLFDSTKATPEN